MNDTNEQVLAELRALKALMERVASRLLTRVGAP